MQCQCQLYFWTDIWKNNAKTHTKVFAQFVFAFQVSEYDSPFCLFISWKVENLCLWLLLQHMSCIVVFFFNFSRIRRVNGLAWTDELTKVTWINIDQLVSSLILSLFLGHLHHILHDVEGPGDTVCFLLITNVNHSWLLPLQSRFFTFCYFSPPLSSPT